MENPFEGINNRIDDLESLLRKIIETTLTNADKSVTPKLVSRKEVKDMLCVSYPTIHRLMKTGELPFIKVGRKTLYKLSDVEKIILSVNHF